MSDDERLVAESITALAMIEARNEAVLTRLRQLTKDPRPAIAKRAAASLEALTREIAAGARDGGRASNETR